MQKNGRPRAAPHCLVAELRAPPQCTRDLKNGNTTRLPPKRTHPNRSATRGRAIKACLLPQQSIAASFAMDFGATKGRAIKACLLPQRRTERQNRGSTFSLAWRIGASLMQRRIKRSVGRASDSDISPQMAANTPRAKRSSSKNAKSMRFNVPAYGTWVLSDYITAGKQPACFHCSTLARTKAHTFGTFRRPDPNSTGCLDPETRNRPDHSDSIASGWPHRGNICPQATPPIG